MTPVFTVIHGGLWGKPVPETPKVPAMVASLFDLLDPKPTPEEPPQRPFTLVKTAAR